MFEEFRLPSDKEVEIEKIKNGYIVTFVKGKIHVKTFNGLVRVLEKIFEDRLIYDKEQRTVQLSNN